MVQEITSSLEYHRQTAYSRSRMSGHSLDWANQPDVYKAYDGISPVPLFKETSLEEQDLWRMFQGRSRLPGPVINIQTISDILRMTSRLTARVRYPGQDFYYRSVASAGALYPNEIYLAHDGIPDLQPGLVHYGIRNQVLHPLRTGKVLDPIPAATGFPDKSDVSASLMITGIFFRSAWKYRARAYRYVLLDAGHVLENLILALQYLSIPFSLHYRFHDREVNHILGVNGTQEACVAVVHLYKNPMKMDQIAEQGDIPPLPESILGASKVSAKEVVYPEILSIHEAGVDVHDSVASGIPSQHDLGIIVRHWQTIEWDQSGIQCEKYPDLLLRRRSKRNYIPRLMKLNDFWGLLDLVCISAGFADSNIVGTAPLQIGFLADRVEGLTPGFYLLNPIERKIGLVEPGQMTGIMTDACLNQDWLANAAVHFLFLANLRFLDQHWGARGYRYAMITAGRIGQIIYLGATALSMGACGIGAFYDDEAESILDLNTDSSLLYLVAAGPVKRL